MIKPMTSGMANQLYQVQREFAPKELQKSDVNDTQKTDKLQSIKESVKDGTYKVDIDKTARAMLDYLA